MLKKKDFLGQKTKLGLSLSRKNGFFKQKVNQFSKKQKKLDFLGQKNKLGLSLSRKKGFFGPKIGEKNAAKWSRQHAEETYREYAQRRVCFANDQVP